ncbi:hypothetical protein NC651_021790 [Populus alba x Populus x berolinensis]|nr:hypothetical protein NC651_021790 [Populus alba x Populus x berolinensis]
MQDKEDLDSVSFPGRGDEMNSVGNLQLAFLLREEDELPLEPIFDIEPHKLKSSKLVLVADNINEPLNLIEESRSLASEDRNVEFLIYTPLPTPGSFRAISR